MTNLNLENIQDFDSYCTVGIIQGESLSSIPMSTTDLALFDYTIGKLILYDLPEMGYSDIREVYIEDGKFLLVVPPEYVLDIYKILVTIRATIRQFTTETNSKGQWDLLLYAGIGKFNDEMKRCSDLNKINRSMCDAFFRSRASYNIMTLSLSDLNLRIFLSAGLETYDELIIMSCQIRINEIMSRWSTKLNKLFLKIISTPDCGMMSNEDQIVLAAKEGILSDEFSKYNVGGVILLLAFIKPNLSHKYNYETIQSSLRRKRSQ